MPDPSTFAEARAILAALRDHPAAGGRGAARGRGRDETPKPGSLPHAEFRLIATPAMALAGGGSGGAGRRV